MATIVDNRLNGPEGATLTPESLAASGSAGTVEIVNADGASGAGAARYDSAYTVHGLSTTRIESSFTRLGTPRLRVQLPPSGPWWARWYVWVPRLQDAGHGINEVRWHAGFPDSSLGYVVHETAAGNVGTRLQSTGLAAGAIPWDSETGNAIAVGQWWRIELAFDGTNFRSQVFAEHDTTRSRIHQWNGRDVGRTLEITGYRYRRGILLQWGANDGDRGDTEVSDLQSALIELGYTVAGGADGWYGQGTYDAVVAFQQDYAYAVVDGEAGPEVLAGVDLALARHRGQAGPPPLYVSHLAVSDSGPLGPAPERRDAVTSAAAEVRAVASAVGRAVEGPAQAARGTATASATAEASKHATTSAAVSVAVSAVASASFRTAHTAASGTASASSGAAAAKHGTASASVGASATSGAAGAKHGVAGASVTARARSFARAGTGRAAIALDYAAGHVSAPFEPVEDDQRLANDVTAKRTNGSEYRAVRETGPMSVQDPPAGIGRYEKTLDVNVQYDVQLRDHAGWQLHLGTYDDARYPTVTVNLAANPALIENVASRESGDWLQVLNPPEWLPPEPIDLLIEGYDERLNAHTWEVTFNASSGGPWTVGLVDPEAAEEAEKLGPREPNRADTEVSELEFSADAGAATLTVRTVSGPPWIDSGTAKYAGMFPFDAKLGGEIVRVTGIDGTGSTQAFRVDRSMNGIVKSHPAGTRISLARPAVVGL